MDPKKLRTTKVAYTFGAGPHPQCFTYINICMALSIIQILSFHSIPTASFLIQGYVISPLDHNRLLTLKCPSLWPLQISGLSSTL